MSRDWKLGALDWDESSSWQANLQHLREAGMAPQRAIALAVKNAPVRSVSAERFWHSMDEIHALNEANERVFRKWLVKTSRGRLLPSHVIREARGHYLRNKGTARWIVERAAGVPVRERVSPSVRALQAGAFIAGVAGVSRLDAMTFQPLGGKASNSALLAALTLGAGLLLRRYPRRKQVGNGLLLASAGLGVGMLVKANQKAAGKG